MQDTCGSGSAMPPGRPKLDLSSKEPSLTLDCRRGHGDLTFIFQSSCLRLYSE